MKSILFSLSLALIFNSSINAQQATDFTVDDCDGVSHHLFSELDAGKVVVIAWVMPCGSCAAPALAAYNAVQSFSSSHPGQVVFYLVDDYANSSCSTIQGWGNNNGMTEATNFSNSAISMSDYGTNGMPKIVVLGGIDHVVAYNKNTGVNTQDVQTAINSILSTQNIEKIESNQTTSVLVAPNPVQSNLKLILNQFNGTSYIIYDSNGKLMQEGKLELNEKDATISLGENIQNGNYIVKLYSNEEEITLPFQVLK
jgi:hypothetical protein